MSDTAFLCCARRPHTYPSLQEPDYDPAEQTVACCSICVPILWFGLFRPEDMRLEELAVEEEGREYLHSEPAPVAAREHLADRLRQSVARIEEALPGQGSLGEHARQLLAAIDAVSPEFPYITIEMSEIAAVIGAEEFYAGIPDVLAHLGGKDDPETVESLQAMFEGRTILPPSYYREGEPTDEEYETLDLLLGEGLYRAVPWEE